MPNSNLQKLNPDGRFGRWIEDEHGLPAYEYLRPGQRSRRGRVHNAGRIQPPLAPDRQRPNHGDRDQPGRSPGHRILPRPAVAQLSRPRAPLPRRRNRRLPREEFLLDRPLRAGTTSPPLPPRLWNRILQEDQIPFRPRVRPPDNRPVRRRPGSHRRNRHL